MSSDTTNYHVPVPLTGQEDTTQALTTWAKSPMNMEIHKTAETECWKKSFELEHAHMNIYHAKMQLCILHNGINMHSFKHLLNMFIMSLIVDMVA